MTGRRAIKVPFELTDARRSGLRAILGAYRSSAKSGHRGRGSRGIPGETTTQPVLDILGGKVICIEADSDRSAALGKKMGNRIVNVCGYYGEVGAGEPNDLAIIDIDTQFNAQVFEKLLDYAVEDGLRPGGYVIPVIVYNPTIAYDERNPLLHPTGKGPQQAFLRRHFGTDKLDAPTLSRKFATHPQFEFVALVDKWMGEGDNSVGWVVLRRRGPGQIPVERPFELTDARRSGLRAILSLIDLPAQPITISVGAQPDAIMDSVLGMVGGRVFCFGADNAPIGGPEEKTNDRIVKLSGRYGEVGAGTPHDLVLIDLEAEQVPRIFRSLIDYAAVDGLKPGGYVVSPVVCDPAVAYDEQTGLLNPEGRSNQLAFMRRHFGADRLDASILARKFCTDRTFEFVALVDRWIGEGRNSVGWVVLRRRPQAQQRSYPSGQEPAAALTAVDTAPCRRDLAYRGLHFVQRGLSWLKRR